MSLHGVVVAAGQGPVIQHTAPGRSFTLKLQNGETAESVMMFEEVAPVGTVTDFHTHHASDEIAYVLSGEIEILDGSSKLLARAGDFVFIPRGIRHRFKNTGVHGARLLFMFTPGGVEGVFRYGDKPRAGHPPPAWGMERFRTPEIMKFNEEFGVEILPE